MNSENTNTDSARAEFIRWVLKRNVNIPMSEIEFLIGPPPAESDELRLEERRIWFEQRVKGRLSGPNVPWRESHEKNRRADMEAAVAISYDQ